MSSMSVDRLKGRWVNQVISALKGQFRCLLLWVMVLWSWAPGVVRAQVPNISYTSPQVYPTGTEISILNPTNIGGAVPGLTYGNVTTFAGSGPTNSPGVDNANRLLATFNDMSSIVRDARGNFYITERGNGVIRKIAANGAVTILMDLDGNFYTPISIAINSSNGDLYFAIEQDAIYRMPNTNSANYPAQDPTYTAPTGTTSLDNIRFAGSRVARGTGDGTGDVARFSNPLGMCMDASNNYLYVADNSNNRIRRVAISPRSGGYESSQVVTITTNGSAAVAITSPEDVTIDGSGNLYVTSSSTRKIHKISGAFNSASLSDFAGSGTAGYLDGLMTAARFSEPRGIDIDAAGNLYVADGTGSHAIRMITTTGTNPGYVSTLAGSGTGVGFSGLLNIANGVGSRALFDTPWDLVVDRTGGAVYVTDYNDDRVRKLDIGGFRVWPTLPLGLSLNALTGEITGTPTARSRQIYYADDFNDVDDGIGSTAGNASLISGWVRLTPDAINQDGGFQIPTSSVNTNGLQVDFTLISSKTTGAEGVSYSFSSDGSTSGAGASHLGTGSHLSLSFVTNSSASPSIRLYYGSKPASAASPSVGTNNLLAIYNSSDNTIWLGKSSRVSLTIDNDGKVTVKIEGTTVFNNVQLPAGYTSADKSTWTHIFRGKTGSSLSDIYAIDDLVIRQNPGAANHIITAYNASGSAAATLNINTGAAPTVTSTTAISITASGASSGGNVTADDDASVTTRGVVWATSANPTVALTTKTSDGSGLGSFTSSITGLSSNTIYYYRAYATNIFGTGYGTGASFTTLEAVPSIGYSSSTFDLILGTAANIELTNTGGTPDVVQVSTLAGSSSQYKDGKGTAARFSYPRGLAVDGSGNLYVADQGTRRIRKVEISTGIVTTIAGDGGFQFVDGPNATAQFASPYSITLDGTGNLYVADFSRIRKIAATGGVSTIAGGDYGFAEGTGANARFSYIYDIALYGSFLFTVDLNNSRIRKVDISSGEVTTLAGQFQGFLDGTGSSARFRLPTGIASDASGNLYVADWRNYRIRKVTQGGLVSTIAGNGTLGTSDGLGSAASFNSPAYTAVDGNGNIYVTDDKNHNIRKISPEGMVTTIAGSGTKGDANGTGLSAEFNAPQGIAVDASGNIYVADFINHRIRSITRYRISPSDLPEGLYFDARTGKITGTPTQTMAATTYTIYAQNSAGAVTTQVSLSVGAPIQTIAASVITETSATAGGTVGSGYTGIAARGVVWSTSPNPSIALSTKTNDGTSTGGFTSSLTSLLPNTTYYVRAYVTLAGTTEYGNEVTFKTKSTTAAMSNVTKSFGDPAFNITNPASNNSPGGWSYTSGNTGVATILGNTVTIKGVGTSTITASQAATTVYGTTTMTFTLTVNGQTPTINLGIPITTQIKDAGSLTISPTSNSGGTVTLTLGSGSIAGVTLNPSGSAYTLSAVTTTGDLVFEASVPATGNYAAGTLTRTMSVTRNNPTLTFALPSSSVNYSNGLTQTLTATGGGSSEPVTFSVVSGPGTTSGVNGSTLNISGPGDIVIKASQAGDATHNPAPDVLRTLTINPVAPTISGFTPSSATEGQTVTITGENFQNVSAVSFGGTAAASFTVVNSTTITAVMGTGQTGGISVTTPSGTDTKAGFRYKVTWTGTTSIFSNTGNWSGGRVPQADDDIEFSADAVSDMELDGNKTVGHVNFNGSASAIRLGAHNLTVKGNLTLPGNIVGTGKVIMAGTSAQTITGGGDIPDLEIAGSGGVTISGSGDELTISGTLRPTSGTLTTNGKLRLSSNSNGTARVAALGEGASIIGDVIAERYIQRNNNSDGTGRAWRLVSVPVTGSGTLRHFFMNGRNGQDLTLSASRNVETENSGTPIVGHNYANASAATGAGFDWIGVANLVSSLRSYVGNATGGSFLSENVPNLSTNYTSAEQGYMVFTRGDRKLEFPSSTSSNATTFRSIGSLKTGTQNVPVATASSSKYTLVGNPYMSVLDLSAMYEDAENSSVIKPSFWIWDANIAGTNNQGGYVNIYKSGPQWVTNTGTYVNPELLESGMAFFVEPVVGLAISTPVKIKESHKSTAASAGVSPFLTDKPDDHGRMYVRLERADDNGQRQLIDGVMADFHSSHKVALTDFSDREKLRNGISRGALWIPREGKALSGEGLPWPTEVKRSIPLYMSGVGDQPLLVHINPSGMRDRYVAAWLKDNVLKREVEINMSQPFDYDFIGTGRADWDSTRFEIVYVESGRPGTGVTLEPDDAAEQPTIKLYPNPSKTAEVKLSLRAMAPGAYTVQVLDMTGRLVATSMLQHRSVNGEYRVLEGRHLSPGQYIVRLIDADKQLKETLRMMVE